MLKDFREFIMRGNVLDLAVGIIIGAAFTTVVNSLVNDLLMPPIGLLISGIDFSEIAITLKEAEGEDPAVQINIGLFINALINFLITALAVFFVVRAATDAMRRTRKEEEAKAEAAPAAPTTEEKLVATLDRLNATLEKLEPPAPPTPPPATPAL